MKIKSVELIENASNVEQASQSRALLAETHEFELLENGWLRWRTWREIVDEGKSRKVFGPWRQSPPSLIRNIEETPEEVLKPLPEDNSHTIGMMAQAQNLDLGLPKRRGRPAKQG